MYAVPRVFARLVFCTAFLRGAAGGEVVAQLRRRARGTASSFWQWCTRAGIQSQRVLTIRGCLTNGKCSSANMVHGTELCAQKRWRITPLANTPYVAWAAFYSVGDRLLLSVANKRSAMAVPFSRPSAVSHTDLFLLRGSSISPCWCRAFITSKS